MRNAQSKNKQRQPFTGEKNLYKDIINLYIKKNYMKYKLTNKNFL